MLPFFEKNQDFMGRNPVSFTLILGLYTACIIGSSNKLIDVSFNANLLEETSSQFGIVLILAWLSVLGFSFYYRVIRWINESDFGAVCSVFLIASFLVLLRITTKTTFFSLITIAVFLLFLKTLQLYFEAKRHNYDESIRKFFRFYVLVYSFSLPAVFLACLYLDMMDFSSILKPLTEFDTIETEVKSIASKGYKVDTLSDSITSIQRKFNSTSVNFYISIIILAVMVILNLFVQPFRRIINMKSEDHIIDKLKMSNRLGAKNQATIKQTLILTRPIISAIAGTISGLLFFHNNGMAWKSILVFFIVYLTSGFGFVLNDYFDIEKDRRNGRRSVLIDGILSKKNALLFSFLLAGISLLLASYVNYQVFLISLLAVCLLSIYSFINNSNGTIANVITAICCSLVIMISAEHFSFLSLTTFAAITVFLFIIGREVLFDIVDIEGDKETGKTSIPIIYGVRKATFVTALFFFLATASTILSFFLFKNLYYLIFMGIMANLFVWFSFLNYTIKPSQKSYKLFVILSRLSLLLIIPALIL